MRKLYGVWATGGSREAALKDPRDDALVVFHSDDHPFRLQRFLRRRLVVYTGENQQESDADDKAPKRILIEIANPLSKRVCETSSSSFKGLVIHVQETVVGVLKKHEGSNVHEKTKRKNAPRGVEQRPERSGRPNLFDKRYGKCDRTRGECEESLVKPFSCGTFAIDEEFALVKILLVRTAIWTDRRRDIFLAHATSLLDEREMPTCGLRWAESP